MLRVTFSRSLNFHFGAFTVLWVLTLINLFTGPSQPIVATVDQDFVLSAYLHPATDALMMTLEWTRPNLSPRYLHMLREGVRLIRNHRFYDEKTLLLGEELKLGNISLKLSRVRISDEGPYRCFLPELDKDYTAQLVVGAASSPVVQKTKNSSRVVLQCNSTGWYPEPEVFWLDGEGNLLSAGPTETVRGPDDLYTVSSRVTVEKRHSNSFTCRVQQNSTNQTRETQIHVPDYFFAGPSGSSSSLPVIIGLILGIVFVLVAAAVVVWNWRQIKIRNKKQREDEVEEVKRQTDNTARKMRSLKKKDKDYKRFLVLNRKEEELQEQLEKLETQLEGLKKDEIIARPKKMKYAADETGAQSLTEEDKHGEQQTAERETLRDREKENLKKEVKQQLEEVKRQTEETLDVKKKEDLQEQLKNFEKLQEDIKNKEIVARQKKLKATNEKEEIMMKLKELEMQKNQSDPVDSFIAGLTNVTLK